MRKRLPLLVILLGILLAGCAPKSTDYEPNKKEITISGMAEKGPFRKGAIVTLYELDDKLNPNGNSFSTTVTDNLGSFEFKKINLWSQYVKITVEGSYFDEVTSSIPDSSITLSAYSNVTTNKRINVNILTHLAAARIKKLAVMMGNGLNDAQVMAQKEVLAAMEIDQERPLSETISITDNSDGAGVLISISSVIMGINKDISTNEILNRFSKDFTFDGKIDDKTLNEQLVTSAKALNPARIKDNLIKYYKEQGKQISVPNLSKFLLGLIKPEEASTMKLTLNFKFDSPPRSNSASGFEADPFTDKFIMANADILFFSDVEASNQKIYGERVTNVKDNTVSIEIPTKILKHNNNSEKFAMMVVVNNTWNYVIAYNGSAFDFLSQCDTRFLNEFNLTSLDGYNMSNPYAPQRGFPACSKFYGVTLTPGQDNKSEVLIERTIAKVRVKFKENPANPEVESLTIKNVNIASTIEGKPADKGKDKLTQRCNLTSGACFYLFPGDGLPTFEIKTKDKTIIQTLDYPSMFEANVVYNLELDLMK